MEKYFYFRDATNEDADLSAAVSATVPVSRITGIGAGSTTAVDIWFKSLKNEKLNEYARLTVTLGKIKEVMAELVQAMNGGPHSDGFVVVADTVVTTDGATSIQGNDKTVSAKFLSHDITGVALTTN
jgi:predicted house-cleaning NTP pyrophosphatase (Maf/HAM1 superfamily)